MKKKLLLISLLAVSIGVGTYYWQQHQNNQQVTYLTEDVVRGDLNKTVIAAGTVRSFNRVDVGAQVSGKIEKIHVSLGQQVKQGDAIADIDSKTQLNTLNTANAQLSSYQAQLKAKQVAFDVAQSAYQRISTLYKQKSASLDDLNNAKNTLAAASAAIEEIQATIKKAEIDVSTAKTNLSYTKILSPIDGVIISIPVSVGQTVNANQTTPTIVQVADLSKMLIKPEISEADITKVKAGMAVDFTTLADPETQYHSQIASVDPAMTTLTDNNYQEDVTDTNAVYFYANVIVDNPDNKLRIGMTTQNIIKIAEQKDALLIPTVAIQKQKNKTFVTVLTEQNKTEQREITLGLNDDLHTQVLSGLKEGEKIVLNQVANGEKVGNSGRGPRLF